MPRVVGRCHSCKQSYLILVGEVRFCMDCDLIDPTMVLKGERKKLPQCGARKDVGCRHRPPEDYKTERNQP